ncbi:hypothetical protein GCM10017600_18430 [Streptosporangium carneum]|uniref:Uncharacterized protein n=1 Tax=Streptosporangium carneum TaxID=47481 RepID=A0A9W6HZI5_9ACTN|nr:hypothetical protein GCM10017600_18430 [Streptosporangium carneum]
MISPGPSSEPWSSWPFGGGFSWAAVPQALGPGGCGHEACCDAADGRACSDVGHGAGFRSCPSADLPVPAPEAASSRGVGTWEGDRVSLTRKTLSYLSETGKGSDTPAKPPRGRRGRGQVAGVTSPTRPP